MAPYGVVAVVVVAGWAIRFVGHGELAPIDTWLYFWPLYAATAERLADGVIPLWNPYQLCGIPWVATLQAGVFYPPHVLYVVLPIHLAFLLSNVAHLLLLGVGTAVFVRRVGLGVAAAVVAVVILTMRGTVSLLLYSPNHLEAYAWLPVGAVACLDLVRRPGARATALLAVSTGLSLLAGYPQPTVYLVYTWASLVVVLLLEARPAGRETLRIAARFAAGIALGVLLAGVQMLPAAELIRVAVRTPEAIADRVMFAVSATITTALMIVRFQAFAGAPASFGVAALSLLPAALATTRRRAVAWWAVGLTIVTALFALGGLTPAFAVYRTLPALGWFREPSRILSVTEFGVAVGAAFGLDAIVGSPTGRARRVAATLAAATVAGIVILAARGWAPPDTWLRVVGHAGIVMVAVAVATIGTRPAHAVATAVLVGLVLFEVGTTPRFPMRLPYTAQDSEQLRAHEGTLRALAARAGHERVWRYGVLLAPDYNRKHETLFGIRGINDYEPISPERQASLFTYFADGSPTPIRHPWLFAGNVVRLVPPPGVAPPHWRRRLIDLTAARFFVIGAGARLGDASVSTFLDRGGFKFAGEDDRIKIFENPSAVPRAFVTYRTRRAPADVAALLHGLSRPNFDPLGASYVDGEPLEAGGDAPRGHPAKFVHDGESEVELEATLTQPGLVVLADAFYPGWHATIDGTPAPILATNHLFRGVYVGEGTHRVRFVYAPLSVRAGAACTLAAIVMLVWLFRRKVD